MGSQRIWWAFLPYALASVVHVWALVIGDVLAAPTKLLLMPFLFLAVLVSLSGVRGVAWRPAVLLICGILLSWLGDGSATFFPWMSDELPMMLVCFGLAHVSFIALFVWGGLQIRARPPIFWWAYVPLYAVLLAVLLPAAGVFAVPVMGYGALLVGTAVCAMRLGRIVAWGGFWFLVSDAVLAGRLFLPEHMPEWLGWVVMLTYTLGQLLIAYGVTRRLMRTSTSSTHEARLMRQR